MEHKQVYIKVNAACDEGVAALVAALSEFAGVVTVDSCENGAWGAYVFFTYGDTWQDLAALLQGISTGLSTLGLPVGFSLVMEWLGSNKKPRALMSLAPEHVAQLVEPLRGLIPTLNARMTDGDTWQDLVRWWQLMQGQRRSRT